MLPFLMVGIIGLWGICLGGADVGDGLLICAYLGN